MVEWICIGVIVGVFGVWGEVWLKSFILQFDDIVFYGLFWFEDGKCSFIVCLMWLVIGGFGVWFLGVDICEDVEVLKGVMLWVDCEKFLVLLDDEFYYIDLIGFEVYDVGGVLIGKVCVVYDYGVGDIFEIFGVGCKQILLLFFICVFVFIVNLVVGCIIVDLFEEEEIE